MRNFLERGLWSLIGKLRWPGRQMSAEVDQLPPHLSSRLAKLGEEAIEDLERRKQVLLDANAAKLEVLARAWLTCDPNRQPADPDEPMTEMSGDLKGKPRWMWFMPRAEALNAFLEAQGYRVMKVTVFEHPARTQAEDRQP